MVLDVKATRKYRSNNLDSKLNWDWMYPHGVQNTHSVFLLFITHQSSLRVLQKVSHVEGRTSAVINREMLEDAIERLSQLERLCCLFFVTAKSRNLAVQRKRTEANQRRNGSIKRKYNDSCEEETLSWNNILWAAETCEEYRHLVQLLENERTFPKILCAPYIIIHPQAQPIHRFSEKHRQH